jgi:predicted amino acid dehydrogenase
MPKGQRDYSTLRVSQHALERFVERFWTGDPTTSSEAEQSLRAVLARTRRIGRNIRNGAVAALGACGDRMLIAIIQEHTCTTVLTWRQFEPQVTEFGRTRLPRKPKRMLKRLTEPDPS